MQNLKVLAVFTLTCLFVTTAVTSAKARTVKVDITGLADFIVDGDTFYVKATNGTEYRIRLADVNAKELGQVGYVEAKEHLRTLVYEKMVYLDVDDIYLWDAHGTGSRLVCVPYVEYNSTHLLNVCEALFLAGQVEKREYDNEFSPYSWSLYVLKGEAIPEFPLNFSLSLIPICMLFFTLAYLRANPRKSC